MNDWRDSEPGDAEYSQVVAFVNQSKDFMLGVEAGRLYQRMQGGESPIAATVHGENQDDLLQLARAVGYVSRFDPVDDEHFWLEGTFVKGGSP